MNYNLCRQIVLQDKRRQVLAGQLLVAQQALDAFDASFEPQVCAVLFLSEYEHALEIFMRARRLQRDCVQTGFIRKPTTYSELTSGKLWEG